MENNVEELKYLALGDSYTAGEGVDPNCNFPNLMVRQLKEKGVSIKLERQIAQTGWTTGEFMAELEGISWLKNSSFDIITLMIGVNNQYRGLALEDFAKDFELIADKCLGLVKGRPERVFILSIPDWGVTPYANEKKLNLQEIAAEIDTYNQFKREIAMKKGFHFLDITGEYRRVGGWKESLTSDQLHPSSIIYGEWADLLSKNVEAVLNKPEE